MSLDTSSSSPRAASYAPEQSPSEEAALQGRRFVGKVAVITGASDRGIGGAIAERLAQEGASILLLGRQEPKRLTKRLAKLGVPCQSLLCDVTRSQEIAAGIEACVDQFGKIDVLVNNAGVEHARKLENYTAEQWRDILDVNLNGTIAVTRAALPVMVRPGSAIVNISSALALGGCTGFSIYSASKAALSGLTQSLAWELAPEGIRVVSVAPGMVHTPMIYRHSAKLDPQTWQQVKDAHPLGMGETRDVAAAVAFLASAEARWITGITLPLGWAPGYPLPTWAFME